MDAPLVVSDSGSGSSQTPEFAKKSILVSSTGGSQSRGRTKSVSGLRKELAASAPSSAICTKTKSKTKASTSILSNLEISTTTSVSISDSTSGSDHELSKSNKNGNDDDEPEDGPGNEKADVDASTPTTPTPRQYGVGRQVVRGSGSDFQCDFEDLDVASKRNSKRSSKRESAMLRRSSVAESSPESVPDPKSEDGNVEDGEPSIPVDTGDDVRVDLDLEDKQDCTTPTPNDNPRRRVKSDETNPSIHPITNASVDNINGSRRSHREKPGERTNLEWTLFLGVPRNAPPPIPTAVNPGSAPSSIPLAAEPNPSPAAGPKLASIPLSTPAPATAHPTTEKVQSQPQTFLPTQLPTMTTTTTTMMTRNRTKSDSALLASAASAGGSNAKRIQNNGKAKAKSKIKRTSGGEDWTLSLPLVAPPLPPFPPVSSSSSASAFRESGVRGRGSKYFEASSLVLELGLVQAEECERRTDGEVKLENGLVITVEHVDRQQGQRQQHSGGECEDEKRDGDEEDEEEALVLRVPRIVRSCSASPLLSTSLHTNANVHNRTKKGSSRWMGATSTPNLRNREGGVERLSSSTLEEEVMCMLLGKTDNDSGLSDGVAEDDESKPKLKKSRKDLAAAMLLAQKKIATLDEDLARFNALLRNGSGIQPSSTVIETVVAAAAAPAVTKTKTVTLNSHPIPASTSTPPKSNAGSQTLPIKPVLKHAKSCEPFLESSGVVNPPFPSFPPSPPHMGPVMRFPSSTGRGDLNFFDELGGCGDGRPRSSLGPSSANLRLTKSAEWRLSGEVGDSKLFSTNTSIPPSPTSRASPPPSTRNSTSSITSITSSTQTVLLPFASTGGSGARRGVPMPSAVGALRPSTAPDDTDSGKDLFFFLMRSVSLFFFFTPIGVAATSHKFKNEKQQRQKPETPTHLPRLHTSSFSSSSSSSQRHTDRRSISPLPQPPSPIASESSSALPTPLASAFPLPPSSLGMAFQQKLREFESTREEHLQQQQRGVVNHHQQQRNQYRPYRPPSTASSVSSLVSNASSTATIVPSGDQKLRLRPSESSGSGFSNSDNVAAAVGSLAEVQENERYTTLEDDEDSMCSSTYYSARSSFSY